MAHMMGGTAPIINPMNNSPIRIPFNNIRDHSVTITGVPQMGRFSIQFLSGNDIFFYINPRIGMRALVRNTFFRGQWGPEERQVNGPFPFAPGTPFQMEIFVTRQHFRVMLNGAHLCDYVHRHRPLNQITHLKFEGMVNISSITFR